MHVTNVNKNERLYCVNYNTMHDRSTIALNEIFFLCLIVHIKTGWLDIITVKP